MTYENAVEAAEFIKHKYPRPDRDRVVLGSGLGAFADELENAVEYSFRTDPAFCQSDGRGTRRTIVLGELGGVPIAVQAGRFHYYEGYDMQQVVFPIRTFGQLGVKNLILTNAAGSLNTDMPQGSLMLITDHLNLMCTNPLLGKNDERFGPRFPDMTETYDAEFQQIATEEASKIAHERFERRQDERATAFLHRGVYCGLSGRPTRRRRKYICIGCSVPTRSGCLPCRKRSSHAIRECGLSDLVYHKPWSGNGRRADRSRAVMGTGARSPKNLRSFCGGSF